jgi:hypothetical protein
VIQYSVGILQHVNVPESHDQIPKAFQIGRPIVVLDRPVTMLRPIDLQDQHGLIAEEIRDKRAARNLPPKF